MSKDNFFVSVDPDGKMPVLTYGKPGKLFWVEYRSHKPVRYCPYPGQDRLWNYATSEYEVLRPEVCAYTATPPGSVDPYSRCKVTKAMKVEVPDA